MPKSLKDLLDENVFESNNEEITEIALSDIKPNPYQPRNQFSDAKIAELADSIKEHGVIQPIIVKPMNGYYVIIAGERRFRACKKLKLASIPAIVRTYEKAKMVELALIENLQRENLSPLEEANAYVTMMKELSYNQSEVAQKVGKSRSYVTNMIGILNLPDEVIELLKAEQISFGHARVLSKLSNKEKICELAKRIIAEGLSVRDIEAIAKLEEKNVPQKEKKSSSKVIYNKIFNDRKIKIVTDKNKITIKVNDGKLDELVEWLLKEIK